MPAQNPFEIPEQIRRKLGWTPETPLLFVEDGAGVHVVTREDALRTIRAKLSGTEVLEQFLAERRAAALAEDAEFMSDSTDPDQDSSTQSSRGP